MIIAIVLFISDFLDDVVIEGHASPCTCAL